MNESYDICVDYGTLYRIEDKLRKISYDLDESTGKMVDAIQVSQDFLAGNQFEKARATTLQCVEVSKITSANISHAGKYIGELRSLLDEYGRCAYEGDR